MKIVVASDTHGDFYELKRVAMKENGADVFLHAGDSEAFDANELSPFASVKGNCDISLCGFPRERFIETPYGLLYMRHYPLLSKEDYEDLKQKGIKIFIHGHTHIKEYEKIDDIYILCPGSLTRPRDGSASYLVLNISKNEVNVEFKSL